MRRLLSFLIDCCNAPYKLYRYVVTPGDPYNIDDQ